MPTYIVTFDLEQPADYRAARKVMVSEGFSRFHRGSTSSRSNVWWRLPTTTFEGTSRLSASDLVDYIRGRLNTASTVTRIAVIEMGEFSVWGPTQLSAPTPDDEIGE